MLGSYYPPYFPTPGQPRLAPGAGGIGAYYQGVGEIPSVNIGTIVLSVAINAGAGYLVGKQLGYPTAGAVATGIFGLPGLFVTALYASSQRKGGSV